MTVRKLKMCKCTHAASFHVITVGRQHRGKCEHPGCQCQEFRRRTSALDVDIFDPQSILGGKQPEVPATSELPLFATIGVSDASEVIAALDSIVHGFVRLRKVLSVRAAHAAKVSARRDNSSTNDAPPSSVRKGSSKSSANRKSRGTFMPVPAPRRDDELHLPPGAQRLLDVLASYPDGALTKTQLGTLAMCPAKKGTFRTYYGLLKRYRLAFDIAENHVRLLPAGRERATPGLPLTRADIVAMWAPKLAPGMRSILDAVVSHGGPLPRDEVGERSRIDPTGGTWRTYFGKLKSNQLLVARGKMVDLGEALAQAR